MNSSRTPVIQRLGNPARDGSVVHINDACFESRGTLEPMSKETFSRVVLHKHRELQTWDPLEVR